MSKRIWDISPLVQDGAPVFPGDTPRTTCRRGSLIALPLKLMTADGSPVRAILRELDDAVPSSDR